MPSPRNAARKPPIVKVHALVLDILGVFSAVYMLARERMLERKCPELRGAAEFDDMAWKFQILTRHFALHRRRFERIPPHKRPDYAPEDRFEALQLMRLARWSVKEAARQLIVHLNTIRVWRRTLERRSNPELFFGRPPFNKIGDAVHWLVHEIRALCPEPEFGTRAIAMQIVRAGIQISRSSVQRFLRTKKPAPVASKQSVATKAREPRTPFNVLRPQAINRTWHLDLTTFDFLFVRFYVAALLDGFSRRLLALRVYRDAPSANDMLAVVRANIREHGAPRFVVTDGGTQFQARFKRGLKRRGVELIKGRDAKRFNGKVERFFRTLKGWKRLTLLAHTLFGVQPRLDIFRHWYNAERPMFGLKGKTPDEMWRGERPPKAQPILARDPQPQISIRRKRYGGDPNLVKLRIEIIRAVQRVA